ncbi:MAG: hypothetical protein IJ507_06595 [Clostridia bacterium]|nr:hypothetical protein [Clostridia bacterium]
MYDTYAYEMQSGLAAMSSMIAGAASYVIALVLSSFVLTFAMRWFIFARAGEKGWKGLIPFYSDYVMYRIAWDGRIYLALLIGQIGSMIISGVLGAVNAGLGTFVGVVCNTAVLGAQAVAGMIMNFKLAKAFGRNDYFAVGLYFLNSVFSAILAFGSDNEYKGPQTEGIGVPGFIARMGKPQPRPRQDGFAQQAAMQQYAAYAQQPGYQTGVHQPVQPQDYTAWQQPMQPQQGMQQGYPMQQSWPQQSVQRTGRRSQQHYGQQ